MPLTVTTTAASNARAAIACTSGTPPYVIYGYTTNNRWLVRGNQVNSYPTTSYTFGANITGWSNVGPGTTTWDSTVGRTVVGSLKNTFTAGSWGGTTTYVNNVVPGEVWTVAAYVRGLSTTQSITGYVTFRTSGGVFLSQPSATVSAPSGSWALLSITATAPATASYFSFEIYDGSPNTVGDGMYVDDVTITSNRLVKTAYDNAVPLQLPTYYEVTDATATKVVSGPVTINQTTPILADALYPSLNTSVVLISQKPNTWESRSVWFDVLGREDPLPVVAPLRYRNGTIKIRAAEPADRAELLSLLTTGRPLLLRQPCHNMSADDVYLLPMRVTESPVVDQYHAGPATFDIEYQAVTRDIGVEWANPRTYDTFTTESATYLILSTAWASYANAAGGAPT